MSERDTMAQAQTGKRFNIYLPADLAERLDAIPRWHKSAAIVAALRKEWEMPERSEMAVVERWSREREDRDETRS